jgi:hypothetical protein
MPGSDALGIKAGHAGFPDRMGVAVLPVWISIYLLRLMLKQGETLDRLEPRETDRKTWQGISPYQNYHGMRFLKFFLAFKI